MEKLNDITLVTVTSIKVPDAVDKLKKCMEYFKFERVKLISDEKPDNLPKDIIFNKISKIDNIHKYNEFMFKGLFDFINTYYALVIQYDSCIINPDKWDNDWLQYDYIGAPWMIKDNAYICHDTGEHVRVGNGGFSLRSRKILNIPWLCDLPVLQEQGYDSEDGNICVYHRKKMLKMGVKYAPVEVASRFCYENPVPENAGIMPFAYHKNLPPYGV